MWAGSAGKAEKHIWAEESAKKRSRGPNKLGPWNRSLRDLGDEEPRKGPGRDRFLWTPVGGTDMRETKSVRVAR